MVRGNCDYLFLQPIYNKTQRDILWDLEAAFMDRKDWNTLMDQVIQRKNLPGNSASEPKKQVRIMVSADFEDSAVPSEKFYHYTPVPIDDLPPFRLCHKKYWEESQKRKKLFTQPHKPTILEIRDAETKLSKL
jgi:hypothetical protein